MEAKKLNEQRANEAQQIRTLFLSPIYVRRKHGVETKLGRNREMCTQTSKTIFELAKQNEKYCQRNTCEESTICSHQLQEEEEDNEDLHEELSRLNEESEEDFDELLEKRQSHHAAVIDVMQETQIAADLLRWSSLNASSRQRASFKSQSMIEPPTLQSHNKKLHFYRATNNNCKQKCGTSNSFMLPTLASEQKNLKHAVDDVKNLVRDTLRNTFKQAKSEHNIPPLDIQEEKRRNNSMSTSSIISSNISSDNALFLILKRIKSPDWNCALKGLAEMIDVARTSDPDLLMPFMTLINQRLLELLRSQRSHVCRTACQLAGHYFETMKDTRRPEFDDIVNLLLSKTADASKFIRHDANVALDAMIMHMPTIHSIRTLMVKGPLHRNPLVRAATVRLLICAVVIAGPATILSHVTYEPSRKRIINHLTNFLEDRNLESRKYGERLLKILAKEPNFEYYLKKYLDRTRIEHLMRIFRRLKKSKSPRT